MASLIPAVLKRRESALLGKNKTQKEAAKGVFTSSAALLANVLAFALAFLGTGPIYKVSVGPVTNFAVSQYGAAMADITAIIWAVIVALSVFAFARATLATAIMLGALALAARFF